MRTAVATGAVDSAMTDRIPEECITRIHLGNPGVAGYAFGLVHPGNLGAIGDGCRHRIQTAMASGTVAVGCRVGQAPAALSLGPGVAVIAGSAFCGVITVNCFGQVFPG